MIKQNRMLLNALAWLMVIASLVSWTGISVVAVPANCKITVISCLIMH